MRAGDMSGKAALVTSAGGGIGRAVALKLAEAGADLCLVDFNAEKLSQTGASVRALGRKAHIHVTDPDDADDSAISVGAAVGAFGRLDALCNVATAYLPASATGMSRADWDTTLSINLSMPFFLMQAAIPHLLRTNGAIVNVTSCVAFMTVPNTAAYAASKMALTHMTQALAAEFADQPIRINAIAPGGMATALSTKHDMPRDLDMSKSPHLPASRGMVDVGRVADAIVFLASDAAEGFHGACLTMDNGLSLR